jgi:hypothetical protein
MRTGEGLLLFLSGIAMATSLGGCGQNVPAAPKVSGAPATAAATQAADLAARVKALEDLIPDQAHIMADVADHFTNLWFAGTAENWPLAEFYLNETRSHLRWAVRRMRSHAGSIRSRIARTTSIATSITRTSARAVAVFALFRVVWAIRMRM